MKILLVYPNTMMSTLVPTHFSLLAACLKDKGFEVDLFDTTLYRTADTSFEQKRVELLQLKPFDYGDKGLYFKKTDVYDDFKKKIDEFQPDLFAFTAVEDTWELAKSLLEKTKGLNIPVIVGGVFVTFSPDEVIADENVDMICVGEGEEALVELCQKIEKGEDYSTTKNLWVKKDGDIIKNPLRPLTDINKLPYIDYDIFGRDRIARPMFGKIYTMLHVELDRGCPYECTYCEGSHLRKFFQEQGCGAYYRRKNVDRLMDEMRHLVKKYNPDFVNFNSETFLARPLEELQEFAEKYKEIALPFWCQTRPETINEDKIKILKEMGCNAVSFGIEHGNEEFRSRMLKRHGSNEEIINGAKLMEKHGIPYSVNNIIGFPEETRELIFDTIELNHKLKPRTINCFLFTPYRGTTLYKYCLDKGYLKKGDKVKNLTDSVRMSMDSISYEELKGLQRTLPLYARFPKSEWPKIKVAEKFDEEGNRVFNEYKKIYQEKYF